MRNSWVTLGALLACVIALGLFVWLKPPASKHVGNAVSTLKPANAQTLKVQRKGKLLIALEKRDGQWLITAPFKAVADDFQVLRLLAALEARSITEYPASDAAKFELETPQAEILIDDQRFAFGAINNVTREQYVLAGNRIVPLDPRFGAAIPTDAKSLLRRTLFAPGDTLQRFEFSNFSVAHDGKKWDITPPVADISQDDSNRWVALWRDASALRAELADARVPSGEIRVLLKSGAALNLAVIQTTPELILRRADLGMQFVFTDEIGKQMLAPPIARK